MSFQLSLSTESVAAAYPDQPLFVAPEASVGEVLQLLRAQKNGSVLVCSGNEGDSTPGGGRLVGIFTERDALRCMAQGEGFDQAVSTVMSPDPVRLEAHTPVGKAIQTMSERGYRNLPIVDEEGMPTGMANVYGIVRYLVDHFPQAIYNLPPKPSAGPSDREGA